MRTYHVTHDYSGTNDDRETQAYLRLMQEKAPRLAPLIEDILETLQEQSNKGFVWEHHVSLSEMHFNKDPLANDESKRDSNLINWGKATNYLRERRGSYRNRIVR